MGALPPTLKAAEAWLQLPTRGSPVEVIGLPRLVGGAGTAMLAVSGGLWQNATIPKIEVER
jgi:hypothetical protein